MDRYNERLVKGKAGLAMYGFTVLAVLVTIFGGLTMFLIDAGIGVLIIAVGIFAFVMLRDQFKVEFEYIITNGDVDIAKIIAKKSRKQMKSIKAEEIIGLESLDDPRVKNDMEVKKDIVIRNFTAKDPNEHYYVLKTQESGKTYFNVMDLDEKSLDNIRYGMKHKMSGAPIRMEG